MLPRRNSAGCRDSVFERRVDRMSEEKMENWVLGTKGPKVHVFPRQFNHTGRCACQFRQERR